MKCSEIELMMMHKTPTPAEIHVAMIQVGDRVFHRRADLFGRVTSIKGDNATVRYEWPWDPEASEVIPLVELSQWETAYLI